MPRFPLPGPLPADAPPLTEAERAWIDQRVAIYSDPAVRENVRRECERMLRHIGAPFGRNKQTVTPAFARSVMSAVKGQFAEVEACRRAYWERRRRMLAQAAGAR